MSVEHDNLTSRAADVRIYIIGLGSSVVLTTLAFAAVMVQPFGTYVSYAVAVFLGFLQILVHLRCFLDLDLSEQKREDVQLILFTVLIIALMAIGTLWILGDLMSRMGVHG